MSKVTSYSEYLQTVRAQEERDRAKFTGEQEPNVECHQWSRDDFERVAGKLKWFKAQNVHIETAADQSASGLVDALRLSAEIEMEFDSIEVDGQFPWATIGL